MDFMGKKEDGFLRSEFSGLSGFKSEPWFVEVVAEFCLSLSIWLEMSMMGEKCVRKTTAS